jgi:hypothetical protein
MSFPIPDFTLADNQHLRVTCMGGNGRESREYYSVFKHSDAAGNAQERAVAYFHGENRDFNILVIQLQRITTLNGIEQPYELIYEFNQLV